MVPLSRPLIGLLLLIAMAPAPAMTLLPGNGNLDLVEAQSRLQQRIEESSLDYEASLLLGLVRFYQGDLDAAIDELEQLVVRAPRFHLAYLLLGDLQLAQTQALDGIGQNPLLEQLKGQEKPLADLRAEVMLRFQAFLNTLPRGRLPRALLQMNASTESALLIDKSAHRLYHYRWDAMAGRPRLDKSYYVSTGRLNGNKMVRGDLKTPEGVYFITRHIPDSKLPEKYGISAFPMNYPNELDRKLGKTGYGIWLHGTDRIYYSRPPLDSEGCVVLPNQDLSLVRESLQPGKTPIVVTEQVEWLEEGDWGGLHATAMAAVENWRNDWESGDVDRYLSHYASDFWSKGHDQNSWKARKRSVARTKEFQKIDVRGLSIFAYPRTASDGQEMIVATFEQDYASNNYSTQLRKRLYMVREQGRWQVLYEGAL